MKPVALLTLWYNTVRCTDLFIKRRIYSFRRAIALQLDFPILLCRREDQLLKSNLSAMKQSLHCPIFLQLKTSLSCPSTPQSNSAWPYCWASPTCGSDPDLPVTSRLFIAWRVQLMDGWKTVKLWVPRQSQSLKPPSYELSSLFIDEVLPLFTDELSVRSRSRGG